MTVEHWVEYRYPGTFVAEYDTKQLNFRNVAEAVAKMSNKAFAFQLFDIRVREGRLEDGTTITDRKEENRSGWFYPDGVAQTLEDVKRELGEDSILACNMRCNRWPLVVKSRTGFYAELHEGDQVITTTGNLISSGLR